MTGANPRAKLNGKSGCNDTVWQRSHRKFVIRLHRDQGQQMQRIAAAAGMKTSTAIAHLLAFALEKLRADKKARDYFEKSIR